MVFTRRKRNAQGAIEYLLILAAAIVVVAIVIGFMSGALGPSIETGKEQQYAYLCGETIDSNTGDCACYHGNNSNGYFVDNTALQTYCCITQTDKWLKEKYESLHPSPDPLACP